MENITIAKVVQDQILKIGLPVCILSQSIKETKVSIGFELWGGIYEYGISRDNMERKIKQNKLDYETIDKLEYFFEDLRSRIFEKDVQYGQASLFDEQEEEPQVEVKQIETAPEDENIIDAEFEEKEEQTCRVCGCTQNNACEGGCYWIEEDLCSQCAENSNDSIGTSDETEKDDTNIVEDDNEPVAVQNKEITVEVIEDEPVLRNVCERCGDVSNDLDINNECPNCAKVDTIEDLITNTETSPFGNTRTLSF